MTWNAISGDGSFFRWSPDRTCINCAWQAMRAGDKELIGEGYIRDVYLVTWNGRKLVAKFLREDYDKRTTDTRIERIHRWEAAALDSVSDAERASIRRVLGFGG